MDEYILLPKGREQYLNIMGKK